MNGISTARLWTFSFVFSLVMVAVIGTKWLQVSRDYGEDIVVVRSDAHLQEVLANNDTIELNGNQSPYLIPTGFFIQSMAFITSGDVNITGYVWQKYPQDYPEDYVQGIVFPEEVDSSSTVIREDYRADVVHRGKPHQLIGWYFDVTVRQSFDYSNYPLDFLTIWLRLWTGESDYDDKILLVPDFDAYHISGPTFGLDEDLVSGEWDLDETFFSYRNANYDTNFGYNGAPEASTYKEFYFNIGAQRKFSNAFIVQLVPLFVVAIILFASLMTISGDSEQADRFGFNTSGILATCSALFFVVLLAHIQVRSQFAGSGLVYIEYFYLVMYVILLLTALDAYLFPLKRLAGNTLLRFRDNLLPKVCFWPLLLGAMAIISGITL